MGVIEKFKAIISELTIKPEVPEDRVKRLTEEDKNTLSECINNLIWTEEYKNHNHTAVYVTAYWEDGIVHIYVNFVNPNYCANDYRTVPCKVKGIKIDKVIKSSAGFGYWDENKKEMPKNARELFECIYYKAYYNLAGRPNQHEKSVAYAEKIGAKTSESKVTFEPPLNLTKKHGGILMEQANKRIIHEQAILHKAHRQAIESLGDQIYSEYYNRCAEMYRFLSGRVNEILGIQGTHTIDDFVNYVNDINLTPEQIQELKQLRKNPMYIRVMGEAALEQKSKLEGALGTTITSYGNAFEDEEGLKYATKTVVQLDQEFETYDNKLSELLKSGKITVDEYDSYVQNLDYIHAYYVSLSKGEQVPFRKMTNTEYDAIRNVARYNGVSFHEQLTEEYSDAMDRHTELQDLQRESMGGNHY